MGVAEINHGQKSVRIDLIPVLVRSIRGEHDISAMQVAVEETAAQQAFLEPFRTEREHRLLQFCAQVESDSNGGVVPGSRLGFEQRIDAFGHGLPGRQLHHHVGIRCLGGSMGFNRPDAGRLSQRGKEGRVEPARAFQIGVLLLHQHLVLDVGGEIPELREHGAGTALRDLRQDRVFPRSALGKAGA